MIKVLVVFYSMYGHVYKLAEAAAEGARSVEGVDSELRRVPETLPMEVLQKMGAVEAQKEQKHIPVCKVEELGSADAIVFGTPTRFGNMCGQMRQFLVPCVSWNWNWLIKQAPAMVVVDRLSEQK